MKRKSERRQRAYWRGIRGRMSLFLSGIYKEEFDKVTYSNAEMKKEKQSAAETL